MIADAETTVIEFHNRVKESEKTLADLTAKVKEATRDVKAARKALAKLLDEMASPQMALPFGAGQKPAPADSPGSNGEDLSGGFFTPPEEDEKPSDVVPPKEDWTKMGLDVLSDHGVTPADRRCLTKAGIATFGELIDFMSNGKGLSLIPGIGTKGSERIEAGINAWLESNPV